ncbi:MAG: twin-arginine translocase TatA/TatE family subunit [Hydrogenobaculum sp.]|nr:MAG: preprotein translocase subunit TatA [Hydrogenobaculum sp.]PMP62320.1 MAG: preprotein translocase subunit TatA [Hydrogenobaculum sp.]PMP90642.1 MAG: preprotein translocase subunit TatA [Hydrogenobaculum sp.]HEK25166.1 preprotein translocase subunit TatA [Hydrogenobaculum sp.]
MDLGQIIIILVIAYIVLGPEKMMDVATKLGEFTRKTREFIDEIKMQAYIENVNKKVLELEKEQTNTEEKKDGEGTSESSTDGASSGTKAENT